MIIIKLKGCLGNQLWQYCCALALGKNALNDLEVFCDVSWYASPNSKTKPFLLKQFFPEIKICRKFSSVNKTDYLVYKESVEQKFAFLKDLFPPPPAIILEGYFQHYRYFEEAGSLFQPHLQPLPPEYQEQEALGLDLVALHVRRGDYLTNNREFHGVLPLPYYKASLERVRQQVAKPYIILFSDDMCWVEQHIVPEIKQLGMPYGLSNRGTVEDFCTMAQCRHFILANSSYSAMAALLSTEGGKKNALVQMPRIWTKAQNILSEKFLPINWNIQDYPFYTESTSREPKVSVIIPVYNTRDYLARCLESVCLQSETAIEIIVVDDASPDDSWSLIQNYARRDTRIVPLRHEQNRHLGGARNTGIEAARSEWLLFLDSDDYIARNIVKIFLHKASQYPQAGSLHCGIVHVRNGLFWAPRYIKLILESQLPDSSISSLKMFLYSCNP